MASRRPFVGRENELERSVGALAEGRSVVVEGTAGVGKSRLLKQIEQRSGTLQGIVRLEASRGRIRIVHRDVAMLVSGSEPGEVCEALDDAWNDDRLLIADDLDTFAVDIVDAVVDGVLCRRKRLVATVLPATMRPQSTRDMATAIERPLVEGDCEQIALGALSLQQTRVLGQALRQQVGERHPAEDEWLASLHRLSGGNPSLIVEILAHACAHRGIDAIEPMDPRSEPISGGLLDAARRSLRGLSASDLRTLALLGDLGPVPSSHLAFLTHADTASRLSDARLLSASTVEGHVAAGELVARVARSSVDEREMDRQRGELARQLVTMAARGTALTRAEEILCARWTEDVDVDVLPPLERQILHGMLTRAAIAVSRSRTPGDGVALAERALEIGPSPAADAAAAIAAAARGDDALALGWLNRLGRPRDRREAELFLTAHIACAYGPGRALDVAIDVFRSWLPDDRSWHAFLDGLELVLDYVAHGESVDFDDRAAFVADASVSEVDAARRCALEALIEALRGRGTRAIALIEPRWRSHGLDTEPCFDVFTLHAYVLVILGMDDERLRVSLRRRLVAARLADRQDQLQTLAVIAAALHLGRHDPDGMFESLRMVDTEPREFLGIWLDLLRACAHTLSHDPGPAADLLRRADRVPATWVGGSYAAVREIARVLFEMATGQPTLAGRRALVAAHRSGAAVPSAALSLLKLARLAGVPAVRVLEQADDLAGRAQLPQLEPFRRELREQLRIGPAAGSWDRLTSREREVAGLAIQGVSTAEIATRLRVSVRTVESHLHHARTRLGMPRSQRFTDLASATGDEADPQASPVAAVSLSVGSR